MGDDPGLIGRIQAIETQPSPPSADSVSKAVHQGAQAASTAGAAALGWAKSGQLAIDPDEGQALVNTLNNEISNLMGLAPHVQQIGIETNLGETPNAPRFTQFNMDVAKTGPHALTPNHELLIQGLVQMSQAVQVAMENYRNTERANAERITRIPK